jgi:hypothetical protein
VVREFPTAPKDSFLIANASYIAKVTGGELKPGSDVGEAIWVEKERIPEIWKDLHDDTKRLLQIAKIVK